MLHRWSNQSDIVIGTVVEEEEMNKWKVGRLFSEFLAVRVRRIKSRYCDLISEVKSMWMGAYAHQDVRLNMS